MITVTPDLPAPTPTRTRQEDTTERLVGATSVTIGGIPCAVYGSTCGGVARYWVDHPTQGQLELTRSDLHRILTTNTNEAQASWKQ